jgi:hypothetical protein
LHEDANSGGTTVSYRQGRRVDERLDEGALQLREEGLDEEGNALEEDSEGGKDGGFDGRRETVADDTNCGAIR